MIYCYIDFDWDFRYLSQNPNISLCMININQHIKWDYDKLSMNKGITPLDIRNNPNIPWNYHILSSNPMNFIR